MAKTLQRRLDEGQDFKKAVNNLYKSDYARLTRLNKRINYMLNQNYCYFITFTLTNKYLNLNIKYLERKIKEALNKSGASMWLLNRDYGLKNGRLHYHAVVSYTNKLDYNDLLALYVYGSINIREIKDKNTVAIRNYLLNHTIKQTASKIMASRI